MAHGKNRTFFGISLLISFIPLIASVYLSLNDYFWMSVLCFIVFLTVVIAALVVFLGIKFVKYGVPIIAAALLRVSQGISPLANLISKTPILGTLTAIVVRVSFFVWFIILLLSDVVMRWIFRWLVGLHPGTGQPWSIINSMQPRFTIFDDSISPTIYADYGSYVDKSRKTSLGLKHSHFMIASHPSYSQSLAFTAAELSRLSYEDVPIIKHELAKAGFDVDRSFRGIAYKNICGYIIQRDIDVFLVFRGTNPLNLQNYWTDLSFSPQKISSPSFGEMGEVHKGIWMSLGDSPQHHVDLSTGSAEVVHTNPRTIKASIELSNTSLWKTIVTSISGLVTLVTFLLYNIVEHIADPTDHRFMGHDFDIRGESMYVQAEKYIMTLTNNGPGSSKDWEGQTDHEWGLETESSGAEDDFLLKMTSTTGKEKSGRRRSWNGTATSSGATTQHGKLRLLITGHSLGGGLATLFLAKMMLSRSPLLENFSGLYTFGMPRIGDAKFAKSFPPDIIDKIFNHAHNNDIFTRVPSWGNYSSPPGTLVFIDSARKIILYPPNGRTNEPVPIRPISYLHLSGLLNPRVIRRMTKESWIRILARFVFPFFLNDHFDYNECLRHGKVEGVVRAGGRRFVAGEGRQEMNPYGVVKRNGEKRTEHRERGGDSEEKREPKERRENGERREEYGWDHVERKTEYRERREYIGRNGERR